MAWSALLTRSRRSVFLCLLLLTIVCGAGLPQLKLDDRLRNLFRSQSPAYALLTEVEQRFGADDNDVLLLVESKEHLVSANGIGGLHAIVRHLQDAPDVKSVRSVLDAHGMRRAGRFLLPLLPGPDASEERYARARQEVKQHALVHGNFLSADGRATLIVATLGGDAASMSKLTPRLERIEDAIQPIANQHHLTLGVTGVPSLRSEMTSQLEQSQWKFALATLVLSSLAALAFYRSWASLLISGIGPVMGLVCTMGLLGWLNIPITPITSIVPPLVFVVGMTDSVHLLFHIQGELRAGRSRREAAMRTMHEMWKPCGLTSLTTSFGFATLMITPMESVRVFGLACALGAAMNFVTVMLCAPLLATTFLGKHISRRAPGQRLADALANFVGRRHYEISFVGAALTAALLPCWLWLVPDNRASEFLPQDSKAVQVLRQTEEKLGGALQAQVMVQWPDSTEAAEIVAALEEAEQALGALPSAAKPVSLASLLKSLPTESNTLDEQLEVFAELPAEATASLLDIESGSALVRAGMTDTGAAANESGFRSVESQLAALEVNHPGWKFQLTGTTVVSYRTANRMIHELSTSLLIAGALIFLCLLVLFRSMRLGIIAVLPNLLPLAATAATLYFTTGVIQYTAVMALTIGIALAVDDTIQFMSRFQQELREGADVHQAADRSLRRVGAVLIVSSIIMLCGFSSLLWCALPPIQLFGALSSVLIVAALAGDALLLPAMVRTFATAKAPAEESWRAEESAAANYPAAQLILNTVSDRAP